jgi:uncharacterized protein (DUF58 family)
MQEYAMTNRRWFRAPERAAWRNFGIAMLALTFALALALFSAAVASQGRIWLAGFTGVGALGIAVWVGIAIVPTLAKRTSLRWIAYQIDYKLTRDGMIYIFGVLILVLAAVNTGNNLLFMILGCALAGILISGVLSRVVLTGIELKFDLPEHIFADQPVLAEMELRNEKQLWPSFSLRVLGEGSSSPDEQILSRPVYFPYIPRQSAGRQKVELRFPHRGIYRQDAFGIRTRFPFGFFEKTRRVDSHSEIVVYPPVGPAEQFYEVLPLLTGEMSSYFRGRGVELHSLRGYVPSDSARAVDWKVTAKAARLMVREFAREDERRVMLVLAPFVGAADTSAAVSRIAFDDRAERRDRFERAVSLAAYIAWHFNEIGSVMQFRTDRFATEMAPAHEIIYPALQTLALIEANQTAHGGAFLDDLASERDVFKIILTCRSQRTIPTALWTSSYFVFIDSL